MNNLNFRPTLNLTEQIADHLAQLVIHGALNGGDRIQELKVAKDLDVSRGSVREALLILERRHLIEIVPRRGAIVNSVESEDALALSDLLAAAEKHWLRRVSARNGEAPAFTAVVPAVEAMEAAAREGQLVQLLNGRELFYVQILKCANKYTRAVFECLLPSSQLVLRKLIECGALEPYDVARYYRALHSAMSVADHERVDELLNAFHKRLHQLCDKSLSSVAAPRYNQRANRWPSNQPHPSFSSA